MTIRASVYYQVQENESVKVWIHVGQVNRNFTIVSGPTSYTKKDFDRLHEELGELRWEELDKPKVTLRD